MAHEEVNSNEEHWGFVRFWNRMDKLVGYAIPLEDIEKLAKELGIPVWPVVKALGSNNNNENTTTEV